MASSHILETRSYRLPIAMFLSFRASIKRPNGSLSISINYLSFLNKSCLKKATAYIIMTDGQKKLWSHTGNDATTKRWPKTHEILIRGYEGKNKIL